MWTVAEAARRRLDSSEKAAYAVGLPHRIVSRAQAICG